MDALQGGVRTPFTQLLVGEPGGRWLLDREPGLHEERCRSIVPEAGVVEAVVDGVGFDVVDDDVPEPPSILNPCPRRSG